jgi:hypothetical protein
VPGYCRPHEATAGNRLEECRASGTSITQLPQPDSQPLSRETADWYVNYTANQLQAFQHDNGNWYLHAPKPARRTSAMTA